MHTILTLELACRALDEGDEGAPAFVTEALEHAQRANKELRELSHGILPAELTMAACARASSRSSRGCRCRS